MNGIYYYLIGFAIIWILSLTLRDKLSSHGFEINFPIIMWKTERLRGFISRITNISPKFWKWYMNFGIVISFVAMLFISWTLLSSIENVLETPSVSIVIPGVEIPGSQIYIPFLSGLIALATVLIVHEFSHGIQAINEKIPIKSIGLLLFIVLPGAFVEPDEDILKKAGKISRLRVYAAGSMENITLALVALLIVSGASWGIPHYFSEDGIQINHIVGDSPSDGVLKEGMVIESINHTEITDSKTYGDVVSSFKPGDNVTVGTDQGDYSVELAKNPNNESVGFFGIQASKHFEMVDTSLGPIPWVLFTIIDLFQWIFTLNLGIGLFNLLPIKPLDGGHMLQILFTCKLSEEKSKQIVNAISAVLGMVVIFSILMSFL